MSCSSCHNTDNWSEEFTNNLRKRAKTERYVRYVTQNIIYSFPYDAQKMCSVLPEIMTNESQTTRWIVYSEVFVKIKMEVIIMFLLCTRHLLPKDLRIVIAKMIHKEIKEVYFERDDGRWKITKEWELIKI